MTTELQEAIDSIKHNFTGQDKAGVPRAAAATDVITLMKAARQWLAVQEAITNEGPQPRLHRKVMKRHQKEWPTLWTALVIREDDNAPTT